MPRNSFPLWAAFQHGHSIFLKSLIVLSFFLCCKKNWCDEFQLFTTNIGMLNSFLQKTVSQRQMEQVEFSKRRYSYWWWQRGRHLFAVLVHPTISTDALHAWIVINRHKISGTSWWLLASTQVLSSLSLSLLRRSVQCLFLKVETFILWQHFVAMALFLLQ